MDITKLNVRTREATGRGSSRRIRKAGEIPAVVYGKEGSFPLAVNEREFSKLWRELHGGASLIEITDEQGTSRLTTVKDLQRHPVRDDILHIDFNEVTRGEKMTATVPLHHTGTPAGVKNEGGVLEIPHYEVQVECLPMALPESLTFDVSELNIGDAVHLSEVARPAGVEILDDPETVVAVVNPPAREEAPAEETEAVAPDEVPTTRDEAEAEDESKE